MMNVESQVLCVLLQTLKDKNLITADVHDKARESILDTLDWPEFFWYGEEKREEDTNGHTQNPC